LWAGRKTLVQKTDKPSGNKFKKGGRRAGAEWQDSIQKKKGGNQLRKRKKGKTGEPKKQHLLIKTEEKGEGVGGGKTNGKNRRPGCQKGFRKITGKAGLKWGKGLLCVYRMPKKKDVAYFV